MEELAKQGKIEFTYVVTGPFLDTFIFSRAGGRVGYDRQNGTYGIVGSENKEEQKIISGTTYKDTGRCKFRCLSRVLDKSETDTGREDRCPK